VCDEVNRSKTVKAKAATTGEEGIKEVIGKCVSITVIQRCGYSWLWPKKSPANFGQATRKSRFDIEHSKLLILD
jgi:hypothetical protein